MGYLHIYCGDGKGKTTAAIGLAVRAAGREKQVIISRFLKTDDSGEVMVLKQLPTVTLIPCSKSFGFTWQMTEQQRQEASQYYTEQLVYSFELARQGGELLVLDEVVGVCNAGLVSEAILIDCLEAMPARLEVVLTGRNPSAALQQKASYLSEIQMKKHPFLEGIPARSGIEY